MSSRMIKGLAALLAVILSVTTVSEGCIVYASEKNEEMTFEEALNDVGDNQNEESDYLVSESVSENSYDEAGNKSDSTSETEESESASEENEAETVEVECTILEEMSLEETEETEELLTIFPEDRYILGKGGHEVYRPENDDELSLCSVTATEQEKKELEALFMQKLFNEPNATEIVFPANKYNVYVVMQVYYAVTNNHPELYYVSCESFSYNSYTNCATKAKIVRNTDYDDAAFNYAVNKALNCVEDSMNDMEKAIALHEYIVLNTEYNKYVASGGKYENSNPVYNAYGVFVNQDAVCNGYALAYKLLLDRVGIDSVFITNENHAWNYVLINGKYYNVDTTWDDPVPNREGWVRHKNFLMSDSACFGSRGHSTNDVERLHKGYPVNNIFATDTRYDNAYWGDVYLPYAYNNGSWFYYDDDAIYKGDLLGNSRSVYFNSFGKWPVFNGGGKVYTDPLTGFFSDGDKMYFNKYDGVYSLEFTNATTNKIYSVNTSVNYIYDVTARNDIKNRKYICFLSLGQDPNKTTISTLDSTQLGIVRNEFTVTYYDLHGNVLKQEIVKKGKSVAAPEAPEENGYFFNFWNGTSTNVTQDLDITPNYGVRGYSITYNCNGGTNPSDAAKNYNILSKVVLPVPTRVGYNFAGWYDNSNLTGTLYTTIEKGNYGDKVFYARWTAKAPAAPIIEAAGDYAYDSNYIIIDEGTKIKISHNDNSEELVIRYSLDGSSVTKQSAEYVEPFAVRDNMIVTARDFRDSMASTQVTKTVKIAVNMIELTNKSMVLKEGASKYINVSAYPTLKSAADVTWTSEDTSVVTVTQDSKVTAVGAGTTVIKATTTDWKGRTVTATCDITVAGAPVIKPVGKSVDNSEGKTIIEKGSKVSIEVADSLSKIYYTTNGATPLAVAKNLYTGPFVVDEDVCVTAVAYLNNQASAVAKRDFVVAESDFELDTTELELRKTEQAKISITKLPSFREESDVKWYSDDVSIVTISSDGTVTAVAKGSTQVHAKVKDWKNEILILDCTVNVEAAKFSVIFKGFSGIEVSNQTINEDESAIAPEVPVLVTGYHFVKWDRSFNRITDNTVINAIYELDKYTITYNPNGGSLPADAVKEYTYESDEITLPVIDNKAGYIFAGWYDNEQFDGSPITEIVTGTTGNRVFFAKWRDERELWMKWSGLAYEEELAIPYTGTAIKPEYEVYYGDKLLELNKDYTATYKNNIKVCTSGLEKDMPTLIITGRGNYTGKVIANFNITPKCIERAEADGISALDIDVEEVAVKYNGRMQWKRPKVTWNGKVLAAKDFTAQYPDTEAGAYAEAGTYNVIITGQGNYSGTVKTKLQIVKTDSKDANAPVLMSQCKVKILPFQYSGETINFNEEASLENITVTYGRDPLIYGTDYTLVYGNDYNGIPCREIGTYAVIVRGEGKYKGELRTKLVINGISIKNVKVDPIAPEMYDGKSHEPEIAVYDKDGAALELEKDYIVTFSNNVNVGTAQVVITGIGGYTGSVKKTFRINARAIDSYDEEGFTTTFASGSSEIPYEKAGARPKLVVKYDGVILKEGTDYSVAYKNNNSVVPVGDRLPTVTITGKKNFKGKREVFFKIVQSDISAVKLELPDMVEGTKAGKYMAVPVLTDVNGKKLAKNVDYSADIEYRDQAGNLLTKYTLPKAGEIINVTVKGKNNYTGDISGSYRICGKGKTLAAARVTVKKESIGKLVYTGEPVTLGKSDIDVVLNGKALSADEYNIVESSYTNNINKGQAKVTIAGVGEYAGYKTVSFSIKPQGLKWWQKINN